MSSAVMHSTKVDGLAMISNLQQIQSIFGRAPKLALALLSLGAKKKKNSFNIEHLGAGTTFFL